MVNKVVYIYLKNKGTLVWPGKYHPKFGGKGIFGDKENKFKGAAACLRYYT